MAENSKIEWTHHTFNPWRGCTKVAEGCKNCYADALSKRNPNTLGVWGPDGTRVMAAESYWREPIKWDREAEAAGERRRVFCASLADVFEDWGGLIHNHHGERVEHEEGSYSAVYGNPLITMNDLRAKLFDLTDATPNLDWLLLTKRPENIKRMWRAVNIGSEQQAEDRNERGELYRRNVWLLTSVATQADYDQNLPRLLKCRDLAAVLGMSGEPQVGPIKPDFDRIWCRHHQCFETIACMNEAEPCFRWQATLGDMLDWWICGGESGSHARPMHPAWARSLQQGCEFHGVPFFFKQWGEWVPRHSEAANSVPVLPLMDPCRNGVFNDSGEFKINEGQWSKYENLLGQEMYRVGKKVAGRLLDGREWNEYPNTKVNA